VWLWVCGAELHEGETPWGLPALFALQLGIQARFTEPKSPSSLRKVLCNRLYFPALLVVVISFHTVHLHLLNGSNLKDTVIVSMGLLYLMTHTAHICSLIKGDTRLKKKMPSRAYPLILWVSTVC
jgi:hypothetical protein